MKYPPQRVAKDMLDSVADTRLVLLSKKDLHEAVKVMAESFSGTAEAMPEGSHDWMLGSRFPVGSDATFHSNKPLRTLFVEFTMSWMYMMAAYYGVNFGVRDPQSGQLLAVCSTRPPGSIKNGKVENVSSQFLTFFRLFGKYPRLPNIVEKRMHHMMKQVEMMHSKHASGPHWYISILAVTPQAQGKGCGGALLRHIHKLADRDRVPCYLETTGDRNEQIYSKLGYTDSTRYTTDQKVMDSLFESGEEHRSVTVTAMVRPTKL